MALLPVGEGELATVVTRLEMTAPPVPRPLPPSPLALVPWRRPEPAKYRALFRRVGARWLWFSRLALDDDALRAITGDGVEVYVVADGAGVEVGMLELGFREAGVCELAYVGLVPELAGRGHGRWLLAQALMLAWRKGVARVHVHTCTLDHPAALPAYLRAGFVPVGRVIETFPDPRLIGLLPAGCAPQIPLLGTETAAAGRVS